MASCAAIASAGCAKVYDLKILAAGIQNNDQNKTRFYVLSCEESKAEAGERLAFIVEGTADQLPELMSAIQKQKMRLVTVHDRPRKTELGEYYYLVECAEGSKKKYEQVSKTTTFQFRYLGSFDVY